MKYTEILDCVFSENTDGLGVGDMADDIILVFPEESSRNKTVRVLKLPKT